MKLGVKFQDMSKAENKIKHNNSIVNESAELGHSNVFIDVGSCCAYKLFTSPGMGRMQSCKVPKNYHHQIMTVQGSSLAMKVMRTRPNCALSVPRPILQILSQQNNTTDKYTI